MSIFIYVSIQIRAYTLVRHSFTVRLNIESHSATGNIVSIQRANPFFIHYNALTYSIMPSSMSNVFSPRVPPQMYSHQRMKQINQPETLLLY